MRPWKETPLGKQALAKTWGEKKENFNDNLYIEESLSLESSLSFDFNIGFVAF
jgi:hypothetical protein